MPAEFSSPPKKFNPIENLRKGKKKTETNPLEETRIRLVKVNRTVKCIHCEEDRILNPEQYQSYFDYWGDEDKIARNFVCKPCDVQIQDNPFRFWTIYGEQYRKLTKALKAAFEAFKDSARTSQDELRLTQTIIMHLNNANISATPQLLSNTHLEFIISNKLVTGLKIKNVPFVGTVTINPYESTKITIS